MAARVLEEFPRAHLTLFDLTVEMIEASRSRLGEQDRIAYRIGDLRLNDFCTDYDVIIASLPLHHATLAERQAIAERIFG